MADYPIFNVVPDEPQAPQTDLMQSLFAMAPPAPAAAPVDNPDMSPVVVQGDNWQPVHRNWLGRAADAMLMAQGRRPIYQQRMDERDMADAMSVYDPNNPMQTIRRIAKIPGMADAAYKMSEQYNTDQERDQQRSIANATKEDLVWQRIGGLFGSLSGNTDEQNQRLYPRVRQMAENYIKMYNLNPDDFNLPDSYDRDALSVFSQGMIKPTDQAKIAVQEKNSDTRATAVQNTNDYRQKRLQQINQHESRMANQFTTNQNRLTNQANAHAPQRAQAVMTRMGPGTISRDGTQMIVHRGGRIYGYQKSGVNKDGSINWTGGTDVTDQLTKK